MLQSLFQSRNTLLEVFFLGSNDPFHLAAHAVCVILPELPLAFDDNVRLGLVGAEVDTCSLGSERRSTVRDRSLDCRLGRSGLRDRHAGADSSDRSNQVRRIGKSVVVPVRYGDRSGRAVWRGVVGLSLWSLDERLRLACVGIWTSLTHLKRLRSQSDGFLGTDDLDDVSLRCIGDLLRILDLSSLAVLSRAREVDTNIRQDLRYTSCEHSRRARLSLQVLQGRTSSTDLACVLRLRHNNTDDKRVLQDLDLLLELGLQSLDELAVSSESDLIVGLVSRLGADVSCNRRNLSTRTS